MRLLKKYWWIIILTCILALGAYLRLYKIREYMTFLGDEGRDVLVVKRIIVDHKFTLLGPTASVGGFFLGPIYYYFMVPFLWLWHFDPVGPAIMVALVGIATIYLVFRVGNDFFDVWAGLIAASLYATSPLVIAYSRSSWNPNVVPFFSVALIYLLWKYVLRKHAIDVFFIGVILGIGIQLHYLFLFLFVLVGVWYLTHIKVIHFWKTFFMTVAGFIIGVSPFLTFELRHGFPNTGSIINFILAGKDTGYATGNFFTTIGDVVFRLYSRLLYRIPTPDLYHSFPNWYITALTVLSKTSIYVSLIFLALILLSTVHALKAKLRVLNLERLTQSLGLSKETYEAIFLLFAWFSLVVLLFGMYKKPIYDYYFGIIFAFPFLILAFVLSRMMTSRLGKIITGAAWAGLVFFNWQGRPFVYPPNNQIQQVENVSKIALSKTSGKPFNFALITDGNSDHAYRYFFEIWGRKPVIIDTLANDPQRKTVMDQLIVICETPVCQPLGDSLWEIAGFGRAEIKGEWDEPFIKIYRLVHYTGIP